ncbi:unnamed protein product, partial [Citrullus colocynthis]
FYNSNSSTLEESSHPTSIATVSSSTTRRDGSSSLTSIVHRKERYLKFEEFVNNVKNVDSVKSELDHYLDETFLPSLDGFNILQWQKLNGV